MSLTLVQLSKLAEWSDACTKLAFYKEQESKLRDELAKELFDTSTDSGTESLSLPNDFQLKITKKLNYKLNNKEGQVTALVAILDPMMAQLLIRWEPDLSLTVYKQLDAATQQLFNGCLTIKPAKPTLEIIPPKVKP